jgi:ankyrin repeat protein
LSKLREITTKEAAKGGLFVDFITFIDLQP